MPEIPAAGFLRALEVRITAAGPAYPPGVRTPRQRRRWRKRRNRALGPGAWRYDAPWSVLRAVELSDYR